MRLLVIALPGLAMALTPEERLGREIYRRNVGVTAFLNKGETEVSGEAFACAGCHGESGEGGAEAGLRVPPVTWRALASAAKNRGAYDAPRFERALMAGIGASGTALNASMPLYKMTREQSAALAAYLKIVGTEADTQPGVDATAVRFGMVAEGKAADAMAAAIRAQFARAGSIYGRRLELVTAASGPALADGAGVFATLAGRAEAVEGAVCAIGPFGAAPAAIPVFPVAASPEMLARVLGRFAGRAAETYSGPASGYNAWARSRSGKIAATAEAAAGWDATARWPDYLASPLPARPAAELVEAVGLERAQSPLTALAWASAAVAVEACRRAGRRLSAGTFREALESMRDFPTGSAAPVTYRRSRRSGPRGAWVLTFDAGRKPIAEEFVIPEEN